MLLGLEKSRNQVEVYNGGSVSQIDIKTIVQIAVKEMGLENVKLKLTNWVMFSTWLRPPIIKIRCTNQERVKHPISSEEAANICLDLWECREIGRANPTPIPPREVFRLAKELKLSGGGIFDCVLAVTAKENKVETIYTENTDDFKAYDFLKASNLLTETPKASPI